LKIFMCWLLDDSVFESANDSTSVPIGKLRKCLSLAECLKPCSQQIQPRLHTDLPLQLHIRSCKKSGDIIPVKRTG
jgi:hypothetical protein